MIISLPRVISLRLLCTLLALAAALLINSVHAAADTSLSAESVRNIEKLLPPEKRSTLSHKARIFTAVEPIPSRTKKPDHSKKAKEKSTPLSHEVIFISSGSEELAAILPLDDACSCTGTARSPPEVLT
jgi:hypothetical protein